jgi:hypothetical protein
MPPRRRSALPLCAFCNRPGLGDPPLCRAHFEQEVYGVDPPRAGEDPLMETFDRVVSDPRVVDWLNRFGDMLDHYAARIFDGVGPQPRTTAGHHAEWPPPPPGPPPGSNGNGRRRRATSPPPPPPPPPPAEDPRLVLGFRRDAKLTVALVKKRHRELALILHPDRDGSDEAMQRLNRAASQLLSQLSK